MLRDVRKFSDVGRMELSPMNRVDMSNLER
jgi:hypothetical protein